MTGFNVAWQLQLPDGAETVATYGDLLEIRMLVETVIAEAGEKYGLGLPVTPAYQPREPSPGCISGMSLTRSATDDGTPDTSGRSSS